MKSMALNWLVGGGAALILSAAARALETPKDTSSAFYRWFYRFTQILLANFDLAKKL